MLSVGRAVTVLVLAAACRPPAPAPLDTATRRIHVEVRAEEGRQPESVEWSGTIACSGGERHKVGTDELIPTREWWIRWPAGCAEPARLSITVDLNWLSCDQQRPVDTEFDVRPNTQVLIKVASCDDYEQQFAD